MVRAFTVCALILAACTAAAQTVTPKFIPQPLPDEKLEIEVQEPTPVRACGKEYCPDSTSVDSAEKPVEPYALLKQKLAELNCLQSEIDELRAATGTPQQVLVKVQAIEISRTKLRKSGIDIAPLRAESSSFSGFTTIDDPKAVVGLIEQLRKNNIAHVLAEPNIVAISGRSASFFVGGEIPLPRPQGSKEAVEYKPFGTQVNLLAIAQGENRVRLELSARIGEIDETRQIKVEGLNVPAISVRQIDTGLDLRFGQTAVLSGLVEKRVEAQKVEDRIAEHTEHVELMFLVTPELVAPTDFLPHASTRDAAAYRTATSDTAERPGERSLRVTKPQQPR
jgi:Flp pilus assembly secretin CpaC